MQYSEIEVHILYTFIRKVYCDPLKHTCIIDNPILIVAHVATVYLYGKINLPRIKRKNSLQTRQLHLQDLPPLQDSYNIFRALDKLCFKRQGSNLARFLTCIFSQVEFLATC